MNEYNDKTEYTDNTIDLCECMFDVEYSWLMVTTIKDNYLFFGVVESGERRGGGGGQERMKERKKLHSTTDVDDDDVDDGTFQVDKGVVFHSQFNLLHVS